MFLSLLHIKQVGVESEAAAVWTPSGLELQRLMLHYAFPPFATNEVGTLREPGRREVGHGALALRALLPALPPSGSAFTGSETQTPGGGAGQAAGAAAGGRSGGEAGGVVQAGGAAGEGHQGTTAEWPFVVRLHSQTLASNGSSSMVRPM